MKITTIGSSPFEMLFKTPYQALCSVSLAMLLTCASPLTVGKEFYRWTDDSGVTHYSSHPPKDRPSEKVTTSNLRATADDNPPADGAGDGEASGDDQVEAASPPAQSEAVRRADPARCEAARKNIRTLQEKSRVRIRDENGELRYLTPEEMADKLRVAQQIVNEEC